MSFFPLTAQAVMLFALVCAFSRAGLNLIDRHQIGHKGLSIIDVNFWNNAVPAIAMVALAAAVGWHRELVASLLDVRTMLFSGLVQLVAYAYSHAFRRLTVSQVTVAGKTADLFIPIGVFFTVGYWDQVTYGFAVATTVICLPLLYRDRRSQYPGATKAAVVAIGSALVLQASLTPLLALPGQAGQDMPHILTFTTAVVVWRMVWSALPFLGRRHDRPPSSLAIVCSPLFIGRVLLSVATQVTFVLAAGSLNAAVAWPILNSTGMLAMMLSSLLLKERPSGPETWAVVAITGLALLRFFSL